ncbi:dynein regulatory complex subunit 4-like isoform X3 [Nerophis ophidion]|uniref:dynein regulatory complex subunit 4-like isoform X3 n=1 Tax=Nerophis ophidion TaxID=159077 RepID=UPI002AE03C7F|nr:dynein regulatory complex subunit 4-like isoform X3 [Nerophis ophidion]
MPPKSQSVSRSKKARTGKTSAAVDVLSTDEMSKQQLEDHVIRLREELDREREERSFFQLERDKIQSFWEVCKRNLEETKAELRNRSREQEEAEERHRVEITVYKQKLKHVLSEQHGAAVETAMDGGVAAWLTRKGHTEGELRLRGQSQKLQADAREKQLNTSRNIQELQLKHEVELMELSKDYDRRLSELEAKYHKKMESTRRAESDRTQAAILQLEDKVSQRVEVLLERHDRTFRGAEEFYSATQSKLLADHKLLQVEEERDALLRKQTEVLLDMQQRSGLKEMLLDQKLALLTESVDKKEAQLLATLSSANIHPAASAAATTRLEDTLRSKRVAIKNLQEELDRQVQEYNKTLQRCREQLEALSVPSYDFLLTPAELILSGQKHPEPAR